jgi:Mrp family chromosome partitioning ATPase
VDANPASSEITTVLGLRYRPGLTDLLENAERSELAVVHPGAFTVSRDPRLFVIPFGRSARRRETHTTAPPWLVERLLKQADFLVLDAAPVARSAASLVWAGAVDATVVVVPRNRAKRAEVSHLFDSLRLVGANPIGVVLQERRRFVRTGGRAILSERADPGWRPVTAEPVDVADVDAVPGSNGQGRSPRVGPAVAAPPEDLR